jgi:hypothetical protein
MMDSLLEAVLQCLGSRPATPSTSLTTTSNKKASQNQKVVAENILTIVFSAEKAGKDLESSLQDAVATCGWTENIAQAILNGLVKALKTAAPMGQALKEAVGNVYNEAGDFANDHPVFVTVIALGILVLLVPWALEALGFAELGIVEGKSFCGPDFEVCSDLVVPSGSWAAEWQATYAGFVPKGSLFSFFQRLGMVWH